MRVFRGTTYFDWLFQMGISQIPAAAHCLTPNYLAEDNSELFYLCGLALVKICYIKLESDALDVHYQL